MDYYLSKFTEAFPNNVVNDYLIFIKDHSFFESLFTPKEQFILFFKDNTAIGFFRISPMGKLQEPMLCPEIKFAKATKKNKINIVGKNSYNGTYTLVKGYREANKSLIIKNMLGG